MLNNPSIITNKARKHKFQSDIKNYTVVSESALWNVQLGRTKEHPKQNYTSAKECNQTVITTLKLKVLAAVLQRRQRTGFLASTEYTHI